jgi:hypothetical protein
MSLYLLQKKKGALRWALIYGGDGDERANQGLLEEKTLPF